MGRWFFLRNTVKKVLELLIGGLLVTLQVFSRHQLWEVRHQQGCLPRSWLEKQGPARDQGQVWGEVCPMHLVFIAQISSTGYIWVLPCLSEEFSWCCLWNGSSVPFTLSKLHGLGKSKVSQQCDVLVLSFPVLSVHKGMCFNFWNLAAQTACGMWLEVSVSFARAVTRSSPALNWHRILCFNNDNNTIHLWSTFSHKSLYHFTYICNFYKTKYTSVTDALVPILLLPAYSTQHKDAQTHHTHKHTQTAIVGKG